MVQSLSWFRGRSPLELPTNSSHIAQPTEKDSGLYYVPSRSNGVTAIARKGSPRVQAQIEEEIVEADTTQRDLTGGEIRQRTPPNQPLRSDGRHSYQQGSILSGEQAASPFFNPDMLHLVPRTPTQGDRAPDALESGGPQPVQRINNLPEEWVEDIHPERQLLYSKVVSSRGLSIRVHTDLPLRSTENHPVILGAFRRLSQLFDSSDELHNAQLKDSEVEACILVSDDFPDEFGYYLVNHRDQTTFWLQEVNASDLDMWAYDEDIYRHKLAEQYWRHVTDFPHHCCLSPKVWDQLGPLMLLGAIDQEYRGIPTAFGDPQTLALLEGFWRQAKEERETDCNKAACNLICASLWYNLVTPRIHNFWGTDYARLERTIAIRDDLRLSQAHRKYSWPIRFICFFLLWDKLAARMKFIDDAWPRGIIYRKSWRDMMTTFSNEWDNILLLSTVIFAGAMAFLAISLQALQGSSDPQETSLLASFAICCGITCAFSVASLIAASNLKRDFGGKRPTRGKVTLGDQRSRGKVAARGSQSNGQSAEQQSPQSMRNGRRNRRGQRR